MSSNPQSLLDIYKRLLGAYGEQRWWPGDTTIEVIVGAILTQNTAWKNVEKAIRNLKGKRLLSLKALTRSGVRELGRTIMPAGYYNVKARRLKNCIEFILTRFRGNLRKMREVRDVWALREDLLGVNGIGCETADSILLYAFNKPVFVVDAYTRRIFSRHGFFREDSRYEDVQKFFMRNLPTDAKLFNEFHALIVKLGKDVCRKRPRCDVCPLAGIPRHTLGKVRTGGRAR